MDSETRTLVNRAIEQDLFGSDVLLEADEPTAPVGYELINELGRGGCGVVYLASDTRLDRRVAIKFLNDASPADLERFRREARFTARLTNPSIVQVYELGEVDDRPYIAMQYVEGGNLATAELDPAATVTVIREIAAALQEAHREGIVHRDIKPANILVDGRARGYLTDFGIARNIHGALDETLSRDGQIIGTPALMPPEQARGDLHAVDARSDVYALGATLYCTLAGRYPFEATNVVDVLHAVIHDPIPLLRSRNASVPRELEAIVVKCMQKCPSSRYQSMAEVVGDLDRYLSGGHVTGGASTWFRRLVSEATGAAEPEQEALPPPDEQLTVGLEIVSDIASWDSELYRVSGSLARSFARLDDIRSRLDEMLAGRPDAAWARFYRGVVLFRRGRLLEAREDMERSIDRVRNLGAAYFELGRLYLALYLRQQREARQHISVVGVDHHLSSVRGNLDQAVVALQEAQRLRGQLGGWSADYAEAVTQLAESRWDQCIAVCDRILHSEPDVEEVWKLRGDAQRLAGIDPFESYDRAIEVRRSYYAAYYAAGEAYIDRGRVAEARASLHRAIRIHPEFVDAMALLARTHLQEAERTGELNELVVGREIAQRAVAIDDGHYDARVTLAEIDLEQGRLSGDDGLLQQAYAGLQRARGLQGCQNRVNLMRGRALLERARCARSRQRDRATHLDALQTLLDSKPTNVPHNEPWEELEAEVVLERDK